MGLPEEDIKRALDLLMAAGLVKRVEGGALVESGLLGELTGAGSEHEENTGRPVLESADSSISTNPPGSTDSEEDSAPQSLKQARQQKQRKPRKRGDADILLKSQRRRKPDSTVADGEPLSATGPAEESTEAAATAEGVEAEPEPVIPPFEISVGADTHQALEIELPPASSGMMEIALPDDSSDNGEYEEQCGSDEDQDQQFEPYPETAASEQECSEATLAATAASSEVEGSDSQSPAGREQHGADLQATPEANAADAVTPKAPSGRQEALSQPALLEAGEEDVEAKAPQDISIEDGTVPIVDESPVSVAANAEAVLAVAGPIELDRERAETEQLTPETAEIIESQKACEEPTIKADPKEAGSVLAEPVLAEPVLAEPVLAEPVLAESVLAEDDRAVILDGPDSPAAASLEAVGLGQSAAKVDEGLASEPAPGIIEAGEGESSVLESAALESVAAESIGAQYALVGSAEDKPQPPESALPQSVAAESMPSENKVAESAAGKVVASDSSSQALETADAIPGTVAGAIVAAEPAPSESIDLESTPEPLATSGQEPAAASPVILGVPQTTEPGEGDLSEAIVETDSGSADFAFSPAEEPHTPDVAAPVESFEAVVEATVAELEASNAQDIAVAEAAAFAELEMTDAVQAVVEAALAESDTHQQQTLASSESPVLLAPDADATDEELFASPDEESRIPENTIAGADAFFFAPTETAESTSWEDSNSSAVGDAGLFQEQVVNAGEPDAVAGETEAVAEVDLSSILPSHVSGNSAPAAAESDVAAQSISQVQSATAKDQDEHCADEAALLYSEVKELQDRLQLLEGTDHYHRLGVHRLASTARINKAFESKKASLSPYRERWPDNAEINDQLDSLLAKYSEAHSTLADLEKRRLYDQPGSGPSAAAQRPANFEDNSTASHPPIRVAIPSTRAWSKPGNKKERVTAPKVVPLKIPPIQAAAPPNTRALAPALGSAAAPQAPPPGQTIEVEVPPLPAPLPEKSSQSQNPELLAVTRFQQGVALFNKKDIYGALPLLREAVKLDARKAQHHYYLGLTLSILSRARKQHKHDSGCHVTCTLEGNLPPNQRVRHEAVEHLRRASELDPHNVQVLADLAALYQDAGMPKRAEYYLDRAMLLTPGNHTASATYGVITHGPADGQSGPPSNSKRSPKK